jgi:2-succinyl-5-enolpyruvyl-6-hydroxy-3-cyclohexene-1-carboxylate synthase
MVEIIHKIEHSRRGIIIVGIGDFADQIIEIIGKISDRTGYPVLVEAIALQRSQFISHYDSFLRSKQFCASHVPDLVIRLGGMPTSKYLSQWLAQHIDCYAEITINFSYSNPLHSNSYNISCDPQQFLTALHNSLQEQQFSIDNRIDNQWRKSFASAQQTTKIVHDRFMENVPFPFEGKVYQLLAEHLPDHSYLYVANSMATRDLDTFFHNDRPIKVLVNKGANGIDGTVSSALGCAYGNDKPTVLICGDIAFFHDINSLLIPKKYPINLTILLLNNDGGAIFNYLKIAEYNPPFQEFFITSHNLDFEKIVTGFGGRYELISDWQKLQQEIKAIPHYRGLKVLEIKIDQQKSYALHQELWQNVTQVL